MRKLGIKTKVTLGLVGLYLLAGGLSFVVFSFVLKGADKTLTPQEISQQRGKIDTSAPKTEECPINGQKYTQAEKDIWEKRRPLAVMIENHEESRPQSGLSSADVVYEAMAEGGISRFMAIFYCGAAAEETMVGPVRSARTYFLDWVSEYGDSPLYTHVGGANKPGPADALGQIKKYGWDSYNDLNQFSIGFPTFKRDYERLGRTVATEHTMYSTTDKLWGVASEDRGLTDKDKDGKSWEENFISWTFADAQPSSGPDAIKIAFPFWGGYDAYSVTWTYDAATNAYKRENGGVAHQDLNTEQQIAASNVVIMFTPLKGPIDELKHMLYTTTGTGKALVFQNGSVIEANWSKKSRTDRTKITNKQGKEISFVRGKIWLEMIDPTTKVEY